MATPDYKLLWQGDFAVFHRPPGQAGVPYPKEFYLPDGIPSRARIQWVEIVYQMDAIDYARVHFIDPHQAVIGYVAEMLLQGGQTVYEPWVVKCGYRDPVPGLPKQWCELAGYPQIEQVSYGRSDPEVTVILMQPTDFLQHHRTIPQGHWSYWIESDQPIRNSIRAIASAHGLGVSFGSLEPAIVQLETHLKEVWKDDPIAQWEKGDLSTPRTEYTIDQRYLAGFPGWKAYSTDQPRTDWDYLLLLQNIIWEWYQEHFDVSPTAGVNDVFNSVVKANKDRVIVKVRDNTLYFCKHSDLYSDLEEVTVFHYSRDKRNILTAEFTAVQNAREGSKALTTLLNGLKRLSPGLAEKVKDVAAKLGYVPTTDSAYADQAPTAPDLSTIIAGTKKRYYQDLRPVVTELWKRGFSESILGELASNIQATVTVLGAPWIHAGSLVALLGFKPGPETQPEPGGQRVNHYERIYVVNKVTHRADETGRFTTEMQLIGASSDNSAELLKQAAEQLSKNELFSPTFWSPGSW